MHNNTTIYRGDILRVTSVYDRNHRQHIGDNYWFVRTIAGRDRDIAGNETGPVRYVYNLVNTNNGKARVTDAARQFTTTADGIKHGVPKHLLEQHLGMRFDVVTTERAIAHAVNKAIQVEKQKGDANLGAVALAKLLVGLLASGALASNTSADTFDVRDYIRIVHQ